MQPVSNACRELPRRIDLIQGRQETYARGPHSCPVRTTRSTTTTAPKKLHHQAPTRQVVLIARDRKGQNSFHVPRLSHHVGHPVRFVCRHFWLRRHPKIICTEVVIYKSASRTLSTQKTRACRSFFDKFASNDFCCSRPGKVCGFRSVSAGHSPEFGSVTGRCNAAEARDSALQHRR